MADSERAVLIVMAIGLNRIGKDFPTHDPENYKEGLEAPAANIVNCSNSLSDVTVL